jgi:hypothetical protein
MDKFIDTEVAARLEGINYKTLLQRIARDKYPEWAIKKTSRMNGGFRYEINLKALSLPAQENYGTNNIDGNNTGKTAAEGKERKERSDKGSTKADESLLIKAAAMITQTKSSTHTNFRRNFGYKKVYRQFTKESEEKGTEVVSYRHFVNMVKPMVDKEAQNLINLGPVRYKNLQQQKLLCDYSVYEPMQLIQSDHSQADAICIHDGKILRPWMAFHNSVGDRYLNYPTICERPDSYSLADNLVNFVFRCGLSDNEAIYKTDNGKAMLSRVMTKEGSFKDETYKGYNIEERHLAAMKLMKIAPMSELGTLQNLGMIESHSQGRQPWTKQIERQFGIGGTMDWFTGIKEYTGRRYQEQPEKLAKLIRDKNIWSSEEMVDFIISQVDDYNHRRHSAIEKERKGKYALPLNYELPLEYFQTNKNILTAFKGVIPEDIQEIIRIFNDPDFSKAELHTDIYSPLWIRSIYNLCGWQSRAIPSKETLAMMIMPVKEDCTIHPYGINLKNLQYIHFKMGSYIGRKANIRYSPSNIIRIKEQSGKEKLFIKEVYVFLKNFVKGKAVEEFLCIAEPHPLVVQGLSPQGYAKTFISIRNQQYKETSRAAKITSGAAMEKECTTEINTPVYGINTFRDQAANELNNEIKNKRSNELHKKNNNTELANELSEIYGQTIGIEE